MEPMKAPAAVSPADPIRQMAVLLGGLAVRSESEIESGLGFGKFSISESESGIIGCSLWTVNRGEEEDLPCVPGPSFRGRKSTANYSGLSPSLIIIRVRFAATD
ncbi:DNAse I-like superfamily protein [Striga asiatica]|uniref:DNAse I-like superfamily protein n=1 Tax=Striga asiatica TaxID=4170 RepID=A0A5A7RED9_STRAF|nr:DNAse I-like superfamily protein [Striga asiatica]